MIGWRRPLLILPRVAVADHPHPSGSLDFCNVVRKRNVRPPKSVLCDELDEWTAALSSARFFLSFSSGVPGQHTIAYG